MNASMLQLAHVLDEVSTRCTSEPWRWVPWLPLQVEYMQSEARERLIRAGMQTIGKTFIALGDLIASALGEHPYRHDGRDHAEEYWVICASWNQSIAIQSKFDELVPVGRLHPSTVFSSKTGYKGKSPAVQIQHRRGGWSLVRFKTGGQDVLDLASATIGGALFDEPPPTERMYIEVTKRVMRRGGWVSIAMTPINRPVKWIRDRVEAGLIVDFQRDLTPAEMIPAIPEQCERPLRLDDGTPCDAAWIADITEKTPAHEVDVAINGGWEVRVVGHYFDTFRDSGDGAHVSERTPGDVDVNLLLGIDHGTLPGKQIALALAVVDKAFGDWPAVYVADEYIDVDGTATGKDDADGIVDMLDDHGWGWHELHVARGDRVHMPGKAREKSNRDLQAHIAKRLGLARGALLKPKIQTAKRGEGRSPQGGSVRTGERWLYHLLGIPGAFTVHPRCVRLIDALNRYTMRDDDTKDPIDALRYALDEYIFAKRSRGTGPTIRFRP